LFSVLAPAGWSARNSGYLIFWGRSTPLPTVKLDPPRTCVDPFPLHLSTPFFSQTSHPAIICIPPRFFVLLYSVIFCPEHPNSHLSQSIPLPCPPYMGAFHISTKPLWAPPGEFSGRQCKFDFSRTGSWRRLFFFPFIGPDSAPWFSRSPLLLQQSFPTSPPSGVFSLRGWLFISFLLVDSGTNHSLAHRSLGFCASTVSLVPVGNHPPSINYFFFLQRHPRSVCEQDFLASP